MQSRDSSGQSGVLVLLGVLFTIILAGLDNTIVSTVMPVALPELGGAHMYAWTSAAYMLAAAVSMPIWGPGSDRWGRRRMSRRPGNRTDRATRGTVSAHASRRATLWTKDKQRSREPRRFPH